MFFLYICLVTGEDDKSPRYTYFASYYLYEWWEIDDCLYVWMLRMNAYVFLKEIKM